MQRKNGRTHSHTDETEPDTLADAEYEVARDYARGPVWVEEAFRAALYPYSRGGLLITIILPVELVIVVVFRVRGNICFRGGT